MKKSRVKIYFALCLAGTFQFWPVSANAEPKQTFGVAKTDYSEAIHGQIDRPDRPNRPRQLVVLIMPGAPFDRDGWTVSSGGSTWEHRYPLRDLAAALVAKGNAVLRFDNPGIFNPHRGCRAAIAKYGLKENTINGKCINGEVLARLSVERYVASVEQVITGALKLFKSSRPTVVLVGFSEGIYHATEIARRNRVRISSIVTIGSPVERFKDISHWQAVDRIVETLQEFDLNMDSKITNTEITTGFERGIGSIAPTPAVWLSPRGYWTNADLPRLRAKLETDYKQTIARVSDAAEIEKLTYRKFENDVFVPDVTNHFWNLHFTNEMSPFDVLSEKKIPALFIWGTKDRQVRVPFQVRLVKEKAKSCCQLATIEFPNRHHMLAKNTDADWFEPKFADILATEIMKFLSRTSH
ncbi:MAG: hypothetical protein ACXW2U_16805 [Telluria sp.]